MDVNLKKEVQESWDKFKNYLLVLEKYESATEADWPILLNDFKKFLRENNNKKFLKKISQKIFFLKSSSSIIVLKI